MRHVTRYCGNGGIYRPSKSWSIFRFCKHIVHVSASGLHVSGLTNHPPSSVRVPHLRLDVYVWTRSVGAEVLAIDIHRSPSLGCMHRSGCILLCCIVAPPTLRAYVYAIPALQSVSILRLYGVVGDGQRGVDGCCYAAVRAEAVGLEWSESE